METVDTHHVTQVLLNFQKLLVYRSAVVAQLGERQTEDLKVPGSIPGDGIFLFRKVFLEKKYFFLKKNS